jgi:hypothetical protein
MLVMVPGEHAIGRRSSVLSTPNPQQTPIDGRDLVLNLLFCAYFVDRSSPLELVHRKYKEAEDQKWRTSDTNQKR